jgi:uncharacterized protein YjbI with pentapeptide repeats
MNFPFFTVRSQWAIFSNGGEMHLVVSLLWMTKLVVAYMDTGIDYSFQNLRNTSFENEDLRYARFENADLRGANFTGSNLAGADFSNAKTGIIPKNTILIFLVALAISALSGYIAMLAGNTVQHMLASNDTNIRYSGILTIIITVLFIVYAYLKGTNAAFMNLIIPFIVAAVLVGLTAYFSGLGTGKGMLFLILALLLVLVMFIVGTVARATAGSLSNILFIIVALSGGMYGKSVGGGIGTVIMAVGCALISKKALSGAKGYKGLRAIALYITSKFGTSFRSCKMANADFSQSKKISNADFSNADISFVLWGNAKKVNCIIQNGDNLQKV